ncbi:MAG: amino acid adenylation domain-containing protein, partial [Acidobacteria bacterium]|nr:amino acid adenylation domain-containing protein [Acidobacteriota bacterium]
AELPVQYADYGAWQRDWLQGEVLAEQVAYWRGQLGGQPAALQLPTDRPRPAVQTFKGAKEVVRLPASLADSLKALSRQEGSTLFMTLLAAFKALLYRYTGQEDILVGTPVAGRDRVEVEKLIGFFVNTLVMRTDLSGGVTFRELVGRMREVALGAYTHHDLPFEVVVEELQPERDLSRNPFFQVWFLLQNASQHVSFELPGLALTPLGGEFQSSQFDLTCNLADSPAGLHCSFEYNSDLFDAGTVRRMLGHFRSLLEHAAADPDRPLRSIPLVTQEEQSLLASWNDTRADYGQAECLHTLFERQAARTPDAVAVTFNGTELKYRELEARANQLARHLRTLGVGPEARAGVCMQRSIEMVVALLGVLKAGAAYVPLDPEYPRERLDFMLEDSQVSVLLTQQALLDTLSPQTARVVALDSDWHVISEQSGDALRLEMSAEHPAYVIYTSGSTGRPKGVVITHRAISNHMLWMSDEMPLDAEDRVLQKTPLSFDASVWEFYAPLLCGAQLVMAPPGAHRDSAALVRHMREESVTVVQVVPSMLRLLVEEEEIAECESLRRVCVGGEALSAELVKRFRERVDAELYNLYGPTEATIDASSWRADGTERVTIGRPVSNVRMYVVDESLNPVPVGVAGELLIGGDGLARGYLNRPGLTAEKFTPNPFGEVGGGRLYRTGDLVRYLAGGELEYLGRIDHQVKVRGFRIELGEIESALEADERVRQAVVVARQEGGESRLVAYVVGEGAAANGLRARLKKELPEYMTPSAFVLMDELPLTPNGKVDRRALPEPEYLRPELEEAYVAPSNAPEKRLAAIWQQVLGVEEVGVEDNFFDLGGHSLLMVQVLGKVKLERVFEQELSMIEMFQYPTISALVGYMERAREEQLSRAKINERAEKQKLAASRQRQAMKQRSRRDV